MRLMLVFCRVALAAFRSASWRARSMMRPTALMFAWRKASTGSSISGGRAMDHQGTATRASFPDAIPTHRW